MCFVLFCIISCSKSEELEISKPEVIPNNSETNNITIYNNRIISFKDKASFLAEIEKIKSISPEKYYNTSIKPLFSKGYKSLSHYFESEDELVSYLQENGIDESDEITFDDKVISDPNFQVLLNSNREIIIDNKLHQYTEDGVYIEKINTRLPTINKRNRNNGKFVELDLKPNIVHDFSQINNNDSDHLTKTNRTNKINNTSYMPFSESIRLPFDEEKRNSIWEKNIGINHTTYVHTPDSKRVKIKYWDTNYFIFNSTGSEVRFQKRKKIWRWVVWQKSYPTRVQLGINNISYILKKPSFIQPVDDWTKNPITFRRHDKTYDRYGKLLSSKKNYPFPFDLAIDIPETIIDIYILIPLFLKTILQREEKMSMTPLIILHKRSFIMPLEELGLQVEMLTHLKYTQWIVGIKSIV